MKLTNVLIGTAVDQQREPIRAEALPSCRLQRELDQPPHQRDLLEADVEQRRDADLGYEQDVRLPTWPRMAKRDDLLGLADPPDGQERAQMGESEAYNHAEQIAACQPKQHPRDHANGSLPAPVTCLAKRTFRRSGAASRRPRSAPGPGPARSAA